MQVIKAAELRKEVYRRETNIQDVDDAVEEIVSQIQKKGDEALLAYSERFDGIDDLQNLKADVTKSFKIDENLTSAIDVAIENISTFHSSQQESVKKVSTTKGVTCWRKSVAIENVGLYIPGGTAPLFSTLLMLAVPAQIAGCTQIVVCTPPNDNGELDPVIGYVANLLGLEKIFLVGGAQAIAAMAFGTETIPKVDKIFGPGNAYVTSAKLFVQKFGVAIDLPAGPSELAVIADDFANPEFVAADLLSQAEHGPDSVVYLLTNSVALANKVQAEINKQVIQLPRKEIATKALENSLIILGSDLAEVLEVSNQLAPEHLILATQNPHDLSEGVINAGSVFLGKYSSESFGDYASGTNHTLPTNGYAKSYSGLSLDSFVKKITFQEVTKEGIENLGPAVEMMADAEQLYAHKNAISVRLNRLKNEI